MGYKYYGSGNTIGGFRNRDRDRVMPFQQEQNESDESESNYVENYIAIERERQRIKQDRIEQARQHQLQNERKIKKMNLRLIIDSDEGENDILTDDDENDEVRKIKQRKLLDDYFNRRVKVKDREFFPKPKEEEEEEEQEEKQEEKQEEIETKPKQKRVRKKKGKLKRKKGNRKNKKK